MTQTKLSFKDKVKLFFKRNMYATIVSGCALLLAVALAVTSIVRAKIIEKESGEPVVEVINQEGAKTETIEKVEASTSDPIVFVYPVKDYTLGETHSDTKLVYNQTLNEWTTHLGVDFIAADGTDVMAAYKGTVESVSYDSLTGTTVVIDHGAGLKSSYSSLADNVMVEVGQVVNSGEVIGKTSSSASGELNMGAHVHFETFYNGESVNPMNYLGEK